MDLSSLSQSLSANRLSFPLLECARELRDPLRDRYARARRGLETGGFGRAARGHTIRHPWRTLQLLVGESDRSGPVWGVTMVRNEEARIEGSLRCLLEGGVDVIIVADNLSTDGTRDLLDQLSRELPIVVVTDHEPAHYQGPKMSRLARLAARSGASWIVPFDADELWYGVGAPLAPVLRSLDGDIAVADMYDFLPDAVRAASDDPYHDFSLRTAAPVTEKVAFRAHLLAAIASGNHAVSQPGRKVRDAIRIRHYPFLGFEHFLEKVRNGGAVLALTNLPDEIGGHWRRWGSMPDDELQHEWQQIVGKGLVEDALPSAPFLP